MRKPRRDEYGQWGFVEEFADRHPVIAALIAAAVMLTVFGMAGGIEIGTLF